MTHRYLLLLSLLIPAANAAVIFTVLDPFQTVPPGDFVFPPSPGKPLIYHGTIQNIGQETFTIDNVVLDPIPRLGPYPSGPWSYSVGQIGLHVAPGQTVNFVPFEITLNEKSPYSFNAVASGVISITLAQNSPLVTTNSQTITYGISLEPATFLPMLASVAIAAVWYCRRQSSRL